MGSCFNYDSVDLSLYKSDTNDVYLNCYNQKSGIHKIPQSIKEKDLKKFMYQETTQGIDIITPKIFDDIEKDTNNNISKTDFISKYGKKYANRVFDSAESINKEDF